MKTTDPHDTKQPNGFLRKWGPYLLPAILLPGGFLIALLFYLRRHNAGQA